MAESPIAPSSRSRAVAHACMVLACVVIAFPLYYVWVASTHSVAFASIAMPRARRTKIGAA